MPEFEPRSEQEMAQIQDLVRSAIGYVDGRDHVQVSNMLFQMDHFQVQAITEQKKENREYVSRNRGHERWRIRIRIDNEPTSGSGHG